MKKKLLTMMIVGLAAMQVTACGGKKTIEKESSPKAESTSRESEESDKKLEETDEHIYGQLPKEKYEEVALQFVEAITKGNYETACSLMAPDDENGFEMTAEKLEELAMYGNLAWIFQNSMNHSIGEWEVEPNNEQNVKVLTDGWTGDNDVFVTEVGDEAKISGYMYGLAYDDAHELKNNIEEAYANELSGNKKEFKLSFYDTNDCTLHVYKDLDDETDELIRGYNSDTHIYLDDKHGEYKRTVEYETEFDASDKYLPDFEYFNDYYENILFSNEDAEPFEYGNGKKGYITYEFEPTGNSATVHIPLFYRVDTKQDADEVMLHALKITITESAKSDTEKFKEFVQSCIPEYNKDLILNYDLNESLELVINK